MPRAQKFLKKCSTYFFILTENSFQLCGSNYLQTHGTAMGTKMAVAFANICMVRLENQRVTNWFFGKGIDLELGINKSRPVDILSSINSYQARLPRKLN